MYIFSSFQKNCNIFTAKLILKVWTASNWLIFYNLFYNLNIACFLFVNVRKLPHWYDWLSFRVSIAYFRISLNFEKNMKNKYNLNSLLKKYLFQFFLMHFLFNSKNIPWIRNEDLLRNQYLNLWITPNGGWFKICLW